MRKLIIALFCSLVVLALSGCGSQESKVMEQPKENQQAVNDDFRDNNDYSNEAEPAQDHSTYSLTVSANCTQVSKEPDPGYGTKYGFRIDAEGTAAGSDVSARLQFYTWPGVQAQLSCGSWSTDVSNDMFEDYAVCKRSAGQPATTAWSGSFSNYYTYKPGSNVGEVRAFMYDFPRGADRASRIVTVTCNAQ